MSAAIAGLAIGVITTGISFAQAGKQRKLQAKAEREADEAMAAARGKLDVNYAEQMSIKKEGYELEREANLSAGAQALEAGVESERGGAATAGRILAAQQDAQGKTRTAMGDELTNIEGAVVEEESRLRDLGVSLDLEEVAGNQQKAAEAAQAAQSAKQQGIQGAVSVAGQAASMGKLYSDNNKAKQSALGGVNFNAADTAKFNAMGDANFDATKIGALGSRDFRKYQNTMSTGQKNMLFSNKGYSDAYRNFNTNQASFGNAFDLNFNTSQQ